MDHTGRSESDLEVSITSSLGGSFISSTPKKPRAPKKTRGVFAVPKVPKPKGPVVGTCMECGKEYRSIRYFEKHKKQHKLQAAASHFPSSTALEEEKTNFALAVLEKMRHTKAIGQWGQMTLHLVYDMLEDITSYSSFIDATHTKIAEWVVNEKFCLPTALYDKLQSVLDSLLCDVNYRQMLGDVFPGTDVSQTPAFETFVVEYMFTLGDHVYHYISESVLKGCAPELSPVVRIDDEERQLIHYVSGYVMRQFFRKAIRYPKNSMWQRVRVAICKCILEGDMVVAACDNDKYWTEVSNRGALLFVGKSYMEFMMVVVKLLYACEKPDGGLLHVDVQEKLLLSPAKILWDKMIGNHLPEQESISFMRGIVQSFTCTYGEGNSMKYVNKYLAKPKASVSLRKRLAA